MTRRAGGVATRRRTPSATTAKSRRTTREFLPPSDAIWLAAQNNLKCKNILKVVDSIEAWVLIFRQQASPA